MYKESNIHLIFYHLNEHLSLFTRTCVKVQAHIVGKTKLLIHFLINTLHNFVQKIFILNQTHMPINIQ